MTDATLDPATLVQTDDIELVFDESPAASPVADLVFDDNPAASSVGDLVFDDAPATAPADDLVFDDAAVVPPVVEKKKGRAPRKGAATEATAPATKFPESAAPVRGMAEEPADPPAPVPQPGEASAGSGNPPVAVSRIQRLMIGAALGLAMLTSLMSLGGLVAVGRTLHALDSDRAQIAEQRAALASVPQLVAALKAGAARPIAASPIAAFPTGSAAVTSDDLHHSLDALRMALDARQPAGMSAVAGTMQAGLSEIGTRLDRIEAAVQRPAPARTPPPRTAR